jgi:hypothetical protein
METPFLQQVAQHLLRTGATDLHDYWLVFPNKRAGLFFKKYIASLVDKPVFLPAIFPIDELFSHFTRLKLIDPLGALVQLYDVHKKITGKEEEFDEFYFWGEMLLNDFDDIDKYLVDAEKLYDNLLDIKEIDARFIDDDNETLRALEQFWKVVGGSSAKGTAEFLTVWKTLYPVYKQFTTTLKEQGLGYQGMIYRDAINQVTLLGRESMPFKRIGFVGFNALTKAEEKLFDLVNRWQMADFYWDYSHEMVTDKQNKAGQYIRRYLPLFPGAMQSYSDTSVQSDIHVVAVPSSSAQVLAAAKSLGGITAPGVETAVVLADESLLMNMLNNMPVSVHKANVTMGYPVKTTQVVTLIYQLFDVQNRTRYGGGTILFHHSMVARVLTNALVCTVEPAAKDVYLHLVEKNIFYAEPALFSNHPLLKAIFTEVRNGNEVLPYLLNIFEIILEAFNATDEAGKVSVQRIDKEVAFILYTRLVRLNDVLKTTSQVAIGRDTVFKIVKRVIETLTLPFEGEPLSGVQVMGILETRNLDFENLIVISANEGVLPSTGKSNTFIPFNLRKGYGLPTVEENDAMYAYYFYRLLKRAQKVTLIYDTTSQGLLSGEPSRYIYQLKYLSDRKVLEYAMTYEVKSLQIPPISVSKSEKVLIQLTEYANGKGGFSASALNTYLDCRLKFYFNYLAKLKKPDEITDDVDARVFGIAFHNVMEELYRPFTGKTITQNHINAMVSDEKRIEQLVKKKFAESYFKDTNARAENVRGKLLIYSGIIAKYVMQILSFDSTLTPFEYVGGELRAERTIKVSENNTVQIKGIIDRIDRVNGELRIVDYKSGNIPLSNNKLTMKSVEELFIRTKKHNANTNAVFQTLLYACLYGDENAIPAVYVLRQFFGNNVFVPQIFDAEKNVVKYGNYHEEFTHRLSLLLGEIFNPDELFDQTIHKENCQVCDFKNICGR